jgi:hypothetical protein
MSKGTLETIWASMPTDRVMKPDTMYGWQVDDNTDNWDFSDEMEDPCELVEYHIKPTDAQIMADERFKALVEALERIAKEEPGSPYEDTICQGLAQDALNALAQIKEPS